MLLPPAACPHNLLSSFHHPLQMKRSTLLLIGFILLKLLLQYFLIHPAYDLQRDEYLHLDQGHHLAWGYISLPPVTSWISFVIHLLGGGVFWVKFFPALFGCLTLVLLFKIIETLRGNLFAFLLTGIAFLVSPVLRLNILFQPNSLDVFSYTLVYYTLIRFFATNNNKWLYATAIAAAFGFLCKYNIVFLLAGLAPALLFAGRWKIFANKHLYFAALLALVLILPNLLWQYNNNFPTIRQLEELQRTQLVNVNRADFFKDQLLYFISSLFIIIAALAGLATYRPFRPYRFILFSFVFSILLFSFMKAKSYYAIGLYPVLMAFGSVYLEKLFSKGWKRYLRPVSTIVVIALATPFILLSFPIQDPAKLVNNVSLHRKLGMLRWEDGKDHNLPQDFADMLGWKELANKTDQVYDAVADKEHTLVLCDNYGQAGAINYYSRNKHINAVSYNADYINWIKLDRPITTVIRIYDAGEAEDDLPKLQQVFEVVQIAARIENTSAREYGTTVLLLAKPRASVNEVIAKDVREKKW
jgi:hypothetical protein